MRLVTHLALGLALLAFLGCTRTSTGSGQASGGATSAAAPADLTAQREQLVVEFVKSLKPQQVAQANAPQQALPWHDLTEAQRRSLERLWTLTWQIMTSRPEAREKAQALPQPGPLARATVRAVGYGSGEARRATAYRFTSERPPVTTEFVGTEPGPRRLTPALSEHAINLDQTGESAP